MEYTVLAFGRVPEVDQGATHCSDPAFPGFGQAVGHGRPCAFFVFEPVSVPQTESSSVSDCFELRFKMFAQLPTMLDVG